MSKSHQSIPFRIVKFLVQFNWYAMLVVFACVVVFFAVVLFGFEPDALHAKVPVRIEFHEDANWLDYADSMRPMILNIEGQAHVLVEREKIPFLKSYLLFLLSACAVYLIGSYQIRRCVALVETRAFFTEEMPKRIRFLGWVLCFWSLFFYSGELFQASTILPRLRAIPNNVAYAADFHVEFVLFGLICFVLAEVFASGTKLKQDQALTI